MVWRIFGPWKNETACEWRKIPNNVLNDLYSSPAIFRLIKSGRIKWAGHVACMGAWRVFYRFLVWKREEKFHFGDSSVDGNILLRWIFRK